jgi:RNA polymerase sigma-B factor
MLAPGRSSGLCSPSSPALATRGLRAELVEAHIGLAEHLARRFVYRGESYDDLVQVGSIALIKAVDRFDPERGVEFTTFATKTILGELKRHFRDKGWAIRAPRRLQELYLHLNQSVASLSQELGRSPTIAELAADTGSTEEQVSGSSRSRAVIPLDVTGQRRSRRGGTRISPRCRGRGYGGGRVAHHPRTACAGAPRTGADDSEASVRGRPHPVGDRPQIGLSQMHVSRLLVHSLSHSAGKQFGEIDDVP